MRAAPFIYCAKFKFKVWKRQAPNYQNSNNFNDKFRFVMSWPGLSQRASNILKLQTMENQKERERERE